MYLKINGDTVQKLDDSCGSHHVSLASGTKTFSKVGHVT